MTPSTAARARRTTLAAALRNLPDDFEWNWDNPCSSVKDFGKPIGGGCAQLLAYRLFVAPTYAAAISFPVTEKLGIEPDSELRQELFFKGTRSTPEAIADHLEATLERVA